MKKLFIIISLVLICSGCDFGINKPNNPNNPKNNVVSTSLKKIDYEIVDSLYYENENQEFNDEYLLNNYKEYKKLNNEYNLNMTLNEEDFDNNTYLLYFYLNSCDYDKDIKEIGYEDNKLEIVYNIQEICGFCMESYYGHLVKLPKLDSDNIKISILENILKKEKCDPNVAYKPIIYLYPTEDMNVSIKLEKPDYIITSYPKYNDGWNVFVKKDGMIKYKNREYYALYWDEYDYANIDFSTGFYVNKENALEFLEEKLDYIGLNNWETNEFIMYWLPILEKNEHNLVYFELTDERENNNKLIISPKPESFLRINMHIKKIYDIMDIEEQKLEKFDRVGFTVVEWAGIVHKEN